MSVVITSNPTKNVNGNVALQSRWSSVHQPIIFGACRQDQPVISVQLIGGVWRMLLAAIPSGLVVGGKLWLKSGLNNQIVTVTGISGLQVSIVGTTPLAPYSTGGYINLISGRKNYYAEIVVYAVDDTNTYVRAGALDSKPGPDGTFTFDVHGFLKSQSEMKDTFLYNIINKKRTKTGSRYNFTIQEFWTGSSTVPSALSTGTTFYWVNSCKQLQQKYNFNVGEHVLFKTIDTAKFMSDFEKPTYFPGFPFSLSFIWSDKVASQQLQRVEDNFTATTTDNLDAAQNLAVNVMMLKGAYAPDVKEIDVWLNDGGIATLHYVSTGYSSPGYFGDVPSIPAIKIK